MSAKSSYTPTSAGKALAEFIKAAIGSANQSFWYRVLDSDDDNPDTVSEAALKNLQKGDKLPNDCKAHLSLLFNMSLQQHTGLSRETYLNILQGCNVLQYRVGEVSGIYEKHFRAFLTDHNIDFELEKAVVLGLPGQRWYLCLGPTHTPYHKSAALQVKAK